MSRIAAILSIATLTVSCSAVQFGATDQPETDSTRDARGPSIGLVDASATDGAATPGSTDAPTGAKPGLMAVGQDLDWGVADWQYMVVSRGQLVGGRTQVRGANLYAQIQDGLNALGAEGWELCYVDAQTGDMFILRRPAVSQ